MVVMAAGAVICDAGITAILTSIISIRDQQAGTNNRKIQCLKRFMKTSMIGQDVQDRVLDFYHYTNTELGNIREDELLEDLSASLRSDVLIFFCFAPLRASELLSDLPDGAIQSLINTMHPYLAIPGERISVIGEDCDNIFVLQKGIMCKVDTSGSETLLPLGSVVGHCASYATSKMIGLPSKGLKIDILAAHGFKIKYGNPYVVFSVGSSQCRSSVKKAKDWRETVLLKLPDDVNKTLNIDVKSWHKNLVHSSVSSSKMTFIDGLSSAQNITLRDKQGKCTGILKLVTTFVTLPPDEVLESHETTSIACSYCHLYKMKYYEIEQLRHFLACAKQKSSHDRLKGQLFEREIHSVLTDKDRIQQGWRRPSHPSRYNLRDCSELLRASVESKNTDKKIEKHHEEKVKELLQTFSSPRRRKTSATIVPIRSSGENSETTSDTIHDESDDTGILLERSRWVGSDKVKTATLTSQCNQQIHVDIHSREDVIDSAAESHGDLKWDYGGDGRNWDILVDLRAQESKPNDGVIAHPKVNFLESSDQCSI